MPVAAATGPVTVRITLVDSEEREQFKQKPFYAVVRRAETGGVRVVVPTNIFL